MPNIIPYNSSLMTSGGSWAFSSGDTPYPLPPSAYNSPLDYTGYVGDFVYTYTVTCGEVTDVSIHEVAIVNKLPIDNNECSSATILKVHHLTTEGQTITEGLWVGGTSEICSTDFAVQAGTYSSETTPANWTPTPDADVWYRIPLPTGTSAEYSFSITLDSGAYSNNPLLTKYMAIYTGACGSLTLKDSVAKTSLRTSVIYYEIPSANTDPYLYLRIGSTTGGYVDIIIDSYNTV